jgi:hypothetical protein
VAESTKDVETEETTTIAPTARQLKSARGFVEAHGKPSKAVVEHVGRGGARVVLVGSDGALGDVFVPAVATGEALVEAVEDLELAEWDTSTVNAVQIGPAHRRKMAGPLARK